MLFETDGGRIFCMSKKYCFNFANFFQESYVLLVTINLTVKFNNTVFIYYTFARTRNPIF